MKKIIYRIQFRFESIGDVQKKRDSRIDSLLSSLDKIDTEKPIVAPFKGSVVEVDGTDYVVTENKLQFVVEEEIVFYTTIVSLTPKDPKTVKLSMSDIEKLKKFVEDNRGIIDADALKRQIYGEGSGANKFWKDGGWDPYVPKIPIV
jgi:hypothetical protein